MHAIQLIMSDIDGTILDDQHQVDPELIKLIPSLEEQDIPFILASARSPLGMAPIAQKLGITRSPLVCYNGALILNQDQVLLEHPLDPTETQQLVQLMQEESEELSINLYSYERWLTDQLDQWTQIEASITGERPELVQLHDLITDRSLSLHKMLVIGEPEAIQSLYHQLLKQELSQTDFYLSKANYLEIISRAASKAQALCEIADHYQLPLSQTMTIGDNFNDLPMIQTAGLGIAMGNAPQEVKDQADAITLSNNESGVATAILQYVLKT